MIMLPHLATQSNSRGREQVFKQENNTSSANNIRSTNVLVCDLERKNTFIISLVVYQQLQLTLI